MSTPLTSALDISGRIGRSFSVTSLLPALFLVLWTYALIASESWQGTPNVVTLGVRLGHLSLGQIALLLAAGLLIGLFLHPLQFATVQLLEGYWGSSALAVGAMTIRGTHYRRRERLLGDRRDDHAEIVDKAFVTAKNPPGDLTAEQRARRRDGFLNSEDSDDVFRHVVARDALEHRYRQFPEGRRVMPTRLGNALRRVEDSAGRQYGLEALTTLPHLALIAPDAHTAYLDDSRRQLDTTAQLCSVSVLATAQTAAALFADGLWLLVALAPYILAYVAYRASVAAATQYGSAVEKIINLDRFLLYEHLGLPKPKDSEEERTRNRDLMPLLKGDHVAMSYEPPEAGRRVLPGADLLRRLFRRRRSTPGT